MKKADHPPPPAAPRYPRTPDGRYFVVRGRLWRTSNPHLGEEERARLVAELMRARAGLRRGVTDPEARQAARRRGERGPVWWTDGAPDFNRRLARNSPYRAWFEKLPLPPAGVAADDACAAKSDH